MPKPSIDVKQVQVVLEDLDFLVKQWGESVEESALRISSPILYRLLVEGHLRQVGTAVGIDVRIMAMVGAKAKATLDPTGVRFWVAGGGRRRMGVVSSIEIWASKHGADSHCSTTPSDPSSGESRYPEKLGKYLALPALIIDGVKVSNEDVIKYVTDKLGGRHYDPSRSNARLKERYVALDSIHESTTVMDTSAVMFSLVSIGAAVTNSSDVHRVRKKCRGVLASLPTKSRWQPPFTIERRQ